MAYGAIIIQIQDGAGNPVGAGEGFDRKITASAYTAAGVQLSLFFPGLLVGANTSTTSGGVAVFNTLSIYRPPAGGAYLKFTTPTLAAVDTAAITPGVYAITFLQGLAYRLIISSFSVTTYTAAPRVLLNPLSVQIADSGGTAIGASNTIPRLIVATFGGPLASENITIESSNNQNQQLMFRFSGEVTFSALALLTPVIGSYNITFTTSGIVSVVAFFTITTGPAYRLLAPAKWTMSTAGHLHVL